MTLPIPFEFKNHLERDAMRTPQLLSIANWLAVAISCLATPAIATPPASDRLICCDDQRVFIVDATDPTKQHWTWTAADSPSIPESFHRKFRSNDDCKPYAGGLILITSSSRGVALIERETKRCLFLADVANAHSACLLPGNQIAVAASTSGDEVQFFSQSDENKPATAVHRIPLDGAHGTVWDASRNRLWAVGDDEILEIVPGGDLDASQWVVAKRYPLPTPGGHDLSPVHDDMHLFVTTNTQVLRFNMAEGTFEVAEGFGDQAKVKSVDVHPVSERIVYQQALPEHWWSQTIRFNDAPPVTLDAQRLYKVRWDCPTKRP